MDRRMVLAGLGATIAMPAAAARPAFGGARLRTEVAALEKDTRWRMGVAIVDTGSGARFAWRADERFPMCSTFKVLLAGAILARVDAGRERLDRAVPVSAADIVANSPFTATRVGATATVAELCAATVGRSDNAAANLLLPAIGGPAGLTRFLRTIGDPVTRLDRTEPSLNSAESGDPRDITTPATMLGSVRRLTLGRVLAPESRAQLVAWMVAATTGTRRLRAGLPPSWRVADKTGAGENGSDNVVALLWPTSSRPPLVVASYINGSPLDLAGTNAIHARLARAITSAM
jgi:beta-lactamase class A